MNDLTYYFNIGVRVVLEVCTFTGNTIIVIIYNTKSFKNQSMSRYISILAIVNIFAANLNGIYTFTYDYLQTHFTCRYLLYIMMIFYQLSPSLSCIIAVDRLISVKYPRRFNIKNKLSFQIAIILIAFIICVGFNAKDLTLNDAIIIRNTTICFYTSLDFITFSTMAMFVSCSLVPFVIMTFCTIVIHVMLVRLKSKFAIPSDLKREVQMFKTMVGLDCFFFISNAPLNIFVFLRPYLANQIIYPMASVSRFILQFQYTFSFFMYLISNKLFRLTFFQIFFKIRSSENVSKSKPKTNVIEMKATKVNN